MKTAYPFLCAGAWTESEDLADVQYPYTGKVVHRVCRAGSEHIEAALAGAVRGFQATKALKTWEKTRILDGITEHLREEEEILFPAIKRAETDRKNGSMPKPVDCETIKASLEKLGHEHEEIGDAVHEIRHLANDYAIPKDACNTFTLTYKKLKEFEDDLHRHVHLENNILFLKAKQL